MGVHVVDVLLLQQGPVLEGLRYLGAFLAIQRSNPVQVTVPVDVPVPGDPCEEVIVLPVGPLPSRGECGVAFHAVPGVIVGGCHRILRQHFPDVPFPGPAGQGKGQGQVDVEAQPPGRFGKEHLAPTLFRGGGKEVLLVTEDLAPIGRRGVFQGVEHGGVHVGAEVHVGLQGNVEVEAPVVGLEVAGDVDPGVGPDPRMMGAQVLDHVVHPTHGLGFVGLGELAAADLEPHDVESRHQQPVEPFVDLPVGGFHGARRRVHVVFADEPEGVLLLVHEAHEQAHLDPVGMGFVDDVADDGKPGVEVHGLQHVEGEHVLAVPGQPLQVIACQNAAVFALGPQEEFAGRDGVLRVLVEPTHGEMRDVHDVGVVPGERGLRVGREEGLLGVEVPYPEVADDPVDAIHGRRFRSGRHRQCGAAPSKQAEVEPVSLVAQFLVGPGHHQHVDHGPAVGDGGGVVDHEVVGGHRARDAYQGLFQIIGGQGQAGARFFGQNDADGQGAVLGTDGRRVARIHLAGFAAGQEGDHEKACQQVRDGGSVHRRISTSRVPGSDGQGRVQHAGDHDQHL